MLMCCAVRSRPPTHGAAGVQAGTTQPLAVVQRRRGFRPGVGGRRRCAARGPAAAGASREAAGGLDRGAGVQRREGGVARSVAAQQPERGGGAEARERSREQLRGGGSERGRASARGGGGGRRAHGRDGTERRVIVVGRVGGAAHGVFFGEGMMIVGIMQQEGGARHGALDGCAGCSGRRAKSSSRIGSA